MPLVILQIRDKKKYRDFYILLIFSPIYTKKKKRKMLVRASLILDAHTRLYIPQVNKYSRISLRVFYIIFIIWDNNTGFIDPLIPQSALSNHVAMKLRYNAQ